jgi:hypothetical protein
MKVRKSCMVNHIEGTTLPSNSSVDAILMSALQGTVGKAQVNDGLYERRRLSSHVRGRSVNPDRVASMKHSFRQSSDW